MNVILGFIACATIFANVVYGVKYYFKNVHCSNSEGQVSKLEQTKSLQVIDPNNAFNKASLFWESDVIAKMSIQVQLEQKGGFFADFLCVRGDSFKLFKKYSFATNRIIELTPGDQVLIATPSCSDCHDIDQSMPPATLYSNAIKLYSQYGHAFCMAEVAESTENEESVTVSDDNNSLINEGRKKSGLFSDFQDDDFTHEVVKLGYDKSEDYSESRFDYDYDGDNNDVGSDASTLCKSSSIDYDISSLYNDQQSGSEKTNQDDVLTIDYPTSDMDLDNNQEKSTENSIYNTNCNII